MARRDPEISGRSVVLVGRFNPAIFHPQWFGHTGLLPEQEANAASLTISAPQVTKFSAGWFECQVTLDSFQVATLQAEMEEPLRDLVVGTFQLLPHTPVWSFGLNFDSHFLTDSVEAWHNFGHKLSPKAIWEGLLERPGMRAVVVQGDRPGPIAGAVYVRVEPSVRVFPGIYVSINDHFDLRPTAPKSWEEGVERQMDEDPADTWTDGAESAIAAIDAEWSAARDRAQTITQALVRET